MSSVDAILIVEDDAGLRELIGDICRELTPEVAHAASGRAALEYLAASQPSLVLLDYSLPDMNGAEVVRSLKALPRVPPFVVMTGAGSEQIAVDMMRQGARDYLVKDSQFLQALPVVIGRVLRELGTEQRLAEATEALVASAREWQVTFDSVKSAIWLMDKEMRILRGNRATETIFGLKSEEIVGLHCWQVVHGTPEPIPDCPAIRASKSLHRESMELRSKDRWFEIVVDPVLDASGMLMGYVHSVSDVTERKRTEEARLHSERRFRELAELLPLAIYEADATGRLTYVNRKAFEYFGYTEKDFQAGATVRDMVAPCDWERVMSRVGRIVGGEPLAETEYALQRKDGTLFPGLIYTTAVRQENQLVGLRGVILDVTEQKKAQQALAESEEKFRAMVEQSADGVLLADAEFRIVLWNRAMEDLFGYSREEMAGKPVWEFRHLTLPADRRTPAALAQFQERAGDLSGLLQEIAIQRKDGTFRTLQVSGFPIRMPAGTMHGALFRDVTLHKHMKEQLVQADKLVALGTLVAGVAHEINNPTNLIMLNSDVLVDVCHDMEPILEQYSQCNGDYTLGGMRYSDLKTDLPRILGGVREGAERIKRIVGDLKRFARAEPPDLSQEVDINEVVRSALTLMDSHVRKITQNLTINLGSNLRKVRGSFQRLEQVVVNLVENACMAMPDDQRAIRVETAFDSVAGVNLIRVADEGVGMSEEIMARLMEPFFTTRRERGGTGLGLSVSHGIVRDHGGEMRFESVPGKGTTVTVALPVKPDEPGGNVPAR